MAATTTERPHAFRSASAASQWLNCAQWARLKRRALDADETIDTGGVHADRGTRLHTIMEDLTRAWMETPEADAHTLLRAPSVMGLEDDRDVEMISSAFHATLALLAEIGPGTTGVELQVSLSHEPGSVGYVDLAHVAGDTLVCADNKFGLGAVEADSLQNKVYASNLVRSLASKGKTFKRVVLAILQPELSEDAIIHETTPGELHDFRGFVDVTVQRQEDGTDERGASNPETCTFCPFKLKCPTNKAMLLDALDVAEEVTTRAAFPHTVERFYRSKKMLEDALAMARDAILEDEEAFPGWSRSERRNARTWDLVKWTEAEIAHQIRKAHGIADPYRLQTPSKIKAMLDPDQDLDVWLLPETTARVLRAKKK